MMNCSKYKRQYYMPPEVCNDWVKKEYVDHAPAWCSVDLRDGNQALIIPMSLEEKVEFFKLLVQVGFKEIEVGFPAASETEYEFLRTLIDQNLIPDDVTIQVLTQAREHIIRKTFEAVKGAPKAIVHVYNSTSVAQREQVFKKSKEEILKIAVDGAKLLKDLADETEGNFQFEYSPESFTGTEPEYALEVCNAVIDVWEPTPDNKVIINLPVTVSLSLPHVYASQIEYMSKHMHRRDSVVLSLHPHNDRGTGVADTELGLLAGADRVEGTLFGNGERTGNVDIITVAMNMYTHGVDPKLDFSNILAIKDVYERVTRMKVHERSPYAGKLVFAAFSGSHQDAIAKGMKYREERKEDQWTVPYIPVDPTDIGRVYEADVIRINSQSGKGGVSFILEQNYGYRLPKAMKEDLGYYVKGVSDHEHREIMPNEIHDLFIKEYVNRSDNLELLEVHFTQEDGIGTKLSLMRGGIIKNYSGHGKGRLDAVSNSIKRHCKVDYKIVCYEEHALSHGSDAQAAAYVGIEDEKGNVFWGAGVEEDIINASVLALISAVNRMGVK
ncbi:MAG: 2-isopropylmalate synthase [Lachnospiraceae bacterium]|nr:2-isopropylmalate synthase [Lachnospiraceae bacterium]